MTEWPIFPDLKGRTPQLEALLETLSPGQFEAKLNMKCPCCGREVSSPAQFKDVLSIREFYITGFCQECQDDFYEGAE